MVPTFCHFIDNANESGFLFKYFSLVTQFWKINILFEYCVFQI